jgi:4-amino-4-deoxy-L-arabinose transferase-like glycosyltransferase
MTRLAAVATLGILAALYVFRLGDAPVYLGGDEAHFGVVAHSIASTGRTLRGDFLPVMVNLRDPLGAPPPPWGGTWYQPFLFYLVALGLKFLPFTEWSVRLPAALLGGLIVPGFIFLFARRVIGTTSGAMAATLFFALSPAHFILSRQARDYIGPIVFVAAWLWCLWRWIAAPRDRRAFASGAVLGVGLFSHISAWMLMPMYLTIGLVVLLRRSPTPVRTAAIAVSGFAIPAAFLGAWLLTHPEMLENTAAAYRMSSAQRPAVFEDPVTASVTAARTFATFLDPFRLFVIGGPNMTASTGRAGVFLLPVLLVLPFGLYAVWKRRASDGLTFVLLCGFVVAIIPAALRSEGMAVQRALCMIIFVAIVAGFGIDWLWRSPVALMRWAGAGLAIAAVLQFGLFYRDFLGHYKFRSAFYYDPVAFASVADALLAQPGVPAYYFDTELDDPAAKWRFYATKANRVDVLQRTRYVNRDAFPIADAPPGSLCVVYVDKPTLDPLTANGAWVVVATITDVDNREAAAILRKAG